PITCSHDYTLSLLLINVYGSLVTVRVPTSGQVVRGEVHRHPISLQDAYVVLAHLAAHVGQHLVPVLELHPERRVGEDLRHGPHHLNGVTSHWRSTLLAESLLRSLAAGERMRVH